MQLGDRGGTVVHVSEEKLSTVVSARFTPTEADELRAVADGRPLSQLLRELALNHLSAQGAPALSQSLPSSGQTAPAQGTSTTTSNFPALSAPGGRAAGWVVQPTAPGMFVGR